MEASTRRSDSITFLLVGLVLLVIVIGIGATFARIIECPDQNWIATEFIRGRTYIAFCNRCGGEMDGVHHNRVTAIQWWRGKFLDKKTSAAKFQYRRTQKREKPEDPGRN